MNKNNDMKYRYGSCLVAIQRYLVSFFISGEKGCEIKKKIPAGPGVCRILPDSQHMLHEQAHGSDADPAAKAQGERFTAGFDEFYNVCI